MIFWGQYLMDSAHSESYTIHCTVYSLDRWRLFVQYQLMSGLLQLEGRPSTTCHLLFIKQINAFGSMSLQIAGAQY